jgi:hypothetical protein
MRLTNTEKTINELATMIWGNDYKLEVNLVMYNEAGKYLRGAYNTFSLSRTGGVKMKAKPQVTALLELCEMLMPKGYIAGTLNK